MNIRNRNLKVGDNICNNIAFLTKLARSRSERKQRHLLKRATSQELLAIVESALNIVKSRFNLTTRQRHRIIPYTGYIRKLSRVRSESGAKRLIQKGNGIGALAAFLTPIIIEVFRHLKNSE